MPANLIDHVRARWALAGREEAPPEVRVVEAQDRFLVTLSRGGTGTAGRLVRYLDFCVRPRTSMWQIVDELLDTYATMKPFSFSGRRAPPVDPMAIDSQWRKP